MVYQKPNPLRDLSSTYLEKNNMNKLDMNEAINMHVNKEFNQLGIIVLILCIVVPVLLNLPAYIAAKRNTMEIKPAIVESITYRSHNIFNNYNICIISTRGVNVYSTHRASVDKYLSKYLKIDAHVGYIEQTRKGKSFFRIVEVYEERAADIYERSNN